jgi:hypothetical protein
MAPRHGGRREVLPARALAAGTSARPEPAPRPQTVRRGFGVLASLAVAGLLLIFTAQVAIAAIFGRTTNGTNTVTAVSLVSPTAASGAYTPSKVVLTWTAASPMNGQGYVVRAFNNGASGVCPVTIGSYSTFISSTAGVTLTDIGAIAQGAPGTFACYLIQTGYSSAGGPPWAAVPQWTSTTALAIASVRLGVVNVQTGTESALNTGSVTVTLPVNSLAGTLLVAIIRSNSGATQSVQPAGWQYANGVNEATNAFRSEIFYYPNNPGGIKTATFTLPGGALGIGQMTEWKNISTAAPFDRSGVLSVSAPTTTVTVSTSAATSVANELTITAVGWSRNGSAYTKGGGWTNLFTDIPLGSASDYRVNLGAAVASETVTSNANETWSLVVATFK